MVDVWEQASSAQNLAGEVAVHLPQEVVYLLASVLVHRGADGPDEAEDEPELHHYAQVLCVGNGDLEETKEWCFFYYWTAAVLVLLQSACSGTLRGDMSVFLERAC